ncbi:TIGR02530 family flagellar biosynthesis protein [Fusibacter tunisiensis]|uniref:Flagellar operon protein n=1 Tax=Fusibacter tunisiensis TaxID=1008308 RepID=A0ABS2MMF9_9FIRM|nr:TIGR02530 family flagellar biosynthesis protein [Fusibacter tunisiensis]MBM7560588.1 flagellar operon protein [Fusibacter tunisiensis]
MSPTKMNSDYMLKRLKVNPAEAPKTQAVQKGINTKGPSFNDVLSKIKDSDQVKFSKHAITRLDQRNITLTEAEMNRIQEGVGKAKSKGVREALIMMDNKVFIASVPNNTIITAATDEQLKENVFTNIDGAVIV